MHSVLAHASQALCESGPNDHLRKASSACANRTAGMIAPSTTTTADQMKLRRARLTRRAWLLGASAGIGALAGRQCLLPTSHPGPTFPDTQAASGQRVLDDASQLCPTPVASPVAISDDPLAGAVERIRAALADARAARRPFIASAARHSMGGQSLARDGTVVTLDQRWLEADTARKPTAWRPEHAGRLASDATFRWLTGGWTCPSTASSNAVC